MQGVVTWCTTLPTAQRLAVFGREKSSRSSPVWYSLAHDPGTLQSEDLVVAKLTSDDMKASCGESADM